MLSWGGRRQVQHELLLEQVPLRDLPLSEGLRLPLIIKQAFEINNKLGNKKIDAIPNSYEKIMTFSNGDLKFIGSFQCMASSLQKLVESLYDPSDKFNNLTFMRQKYPQHIERLCQEGYYPYAWVNAIKKLDPQGLPPNNMHYTHR